MNEDETPLHQIIWQRFLKAMGTPPPISEAEQSWWQEVWMNRITIVRASLITSAAAYLVNASWFTPSSMLGAVQGLLPSYSNFASGYKVAGLLLLALMSPLVLSWGTRCWRYCCHHSFTPLFAIALLVAWGWIAHHPECLTFVQWVCAIFLFIGVTALGWQSQEPDLVILDDLQREYFVERLFDLFQVPNATMKRIAVLGTWGTGKTTVLHLLRQRLKQSKSPEFGVALVNPWVAKTPEDMQRMIVEAFDEAAGQQNYFASPWARIPWLSWLTGFKAAAGFGLNFDLKQIFEGGSALQEQKLIQRVNFDLRALKKTCVILVDDMERADPEIIRKMFPVINVLRDIESCFFVFAIDPDRVAKAFEEDGHSSVETKGYLDKVFDLQLTLPGARIKDIAKMCRGLIDHSKTPKLHAAWDSIKSELPVTPREAIHFMRDAIMRETLFLTRYGPEEHDFIGFFKLRLLAIENPSLVERINPELAEDFRGARYAAFLMQHRGQELDEQSKQKLDNAWDQATQGLKIDQSRASKLKSLFEEVLSSSVDLPWACHHHMRLLTLNHEQRLALQQVWRNNASAKSIIDMIPIAAPGLSFDDPDQIATQLLETEITEYESIRSRLIGARGVMQASDLLRDALQRLENLIAHVRFTASSGLDREFYPENCFNSWITLMFQGHLPDSQVNTSELRQREQDCSVALASLLSTHDAYHFARFSTRNIIDRESIQNRRDDLTPHIDAVRSVLQERLYREFVGDIRSGQIAQQSFLGHLGLNHLAQLFGDLEAWNPYSDDLGALRRLESELPHNPQISCSMTAIASALLQAVKYIAEHGRGDRVDITRLTVSDRPDYLALVWRMALKTQSDRDKLLARHASTRRSTGDNKAITTQQFDQAFPIDSQIESP